MNTVSEFSVYTTYIGNPDPNIETYAIGLLLDFGIPTHSLGILGTFNGKKAQYNGFEYDLAAVHAGQGNYTINPGIPKGIMIPPSEEPVKIILYKWPDNLAATIDTGGMVGGSGCAPGSNQIVGSECVVGTYCNTSSGIANEATCNPDKSVGGGQMPNVIWIPFTDDIPTWVEVFPILYKWKPVQGKWEFSTRSPANPTTKILGSTGFTLRLVPGGMIQLVSNNLGSAPYSYVNYTPGMITTWPGGLFHLQLGTVLDGTPEQVGTNLGAVAKYRVTNPCYSTCVRLFS